MKDNPTPNSAEGVFAAMLDAGRTREQVLSGIGLINQGMKEGRVKTQISCLDNVVGFFEMANRMFIKNEAMAIEDAELGVHQGMCKSPICNKLTIVYYEVLRPSQPKDSAKISEMLKNLLKEIILGKPRPDLKGTDTGYFDSQTGKDLPVIKAVEITDKCIRDGAEEIRILYSRASRGHMAVVDILLPRNSRMFPAYWIDQPFTPDGNLVGMDPELLRAIVLVNAPKEKLLK